MANRITTILDFENRGQGLKRLKQEVNDAEGAIGKLKAGWKGAVAEFKNSRAAQAAVGAIAVETARRSIQASVALEESVNAITVVYGEQSDAVLKLGDDSVDAFGMSKRAFNDFAVQFAGFAKQIAERDGRAVADVVQEMATRVADFASVHNLSLEEAARVAQSTLAGETEAFRRYSGDVSAATVKTHAYEQGIAKVGEELTESQKVLARYSLFMEQTSDRAGDFANTQDSAAGAAKRLQANMEDLQAELGDRLIPAVTQLANGLNDVLAIAGEIEDKDPTGIFGELTSKGSIQLFAEGIALAGDTIQEFWQQEKLTEEQTQRLSSALQGVIDQVAETPDRLKDAADSVQSYGKAELNRAEALREVSEATDDANKALSESEKQLEKTRRENDRTTRAIQKLDSAYNNLRDSLNDRRSFLQLEQDFARIGEQADATESDVIDLKLAVIDYAESINLPEQVLTKIIAELDTGKRDEVLAFLRRLGDGVTVPIRAQTISSSSSRASQSTTLRVDSGGNVSTGGGGTGRAFGAEGAVVNRRTDNVTLGEAGKEAVIPLDKVPGNAPIESILGNGSPAPASITVPVTINVKGELIDERTIRRLYDAAPDAFAQAVRRANAHANRFNP